MKKLILVSGIIAIALMAGCGGKNETADLKQDGITVSFQFPKGFFTRSDNANDYIAGEKDGYAFVGKDFTMQVTMGVSFGKTESWDRIKQDKVRAKNEFLQDITIAGAKDAYQFYWKPSLAYTILLEQNRYVEIQFCPKDLVNLSDKDFRNFARNDEFLGKSKAILESQEAQDIVKSLRIKLEVDDN